MVVDEIVVKPKEFNAAIIKIMEEYGKETFTRINKVTNEVTKDTKKEVKKNANVETKEPLRFPNRVKRYKKSISYRTEKNGVMNYGRVYAKNHEYSLTHLLENGHKLWNAPGKRTRAFPHWKKGEELAQKEFAKEIIKELQK